MCFRHQVCHLLCALYPPPPPPPPFSTLSIQVNETVFCKSGHQSSSSCWVSNIFALWTVLDIRFMSGFGLHDARSAAFLLFCVCVCVVDMKCALVKYVRNNHLNWLLVLISCIKMLHSVCRVNCFIQKLFHAKCEGVMVLRKEEIFRTCGWHCIGGFLFLICSFLLGGWLWLQSVAWGQCPPAVSRGVVSGAAVWGRPRLQRTHETDGSYSPAASPLAVSLCLVTVPVCVCVCVCVCGGLCVCMHACMCECMLVCVCVCYVRACMHMCICVCVWCEWSVWGGRWVVGVN